MQENGIDSYGDLAGKSDAASDEFYGLTRKIKDAETRLKGISELQKQIGAYTKTRSVYAQYKASKWNRDFYDGHAAEITQHRTSKKFFDTQGFKGKLPSIASLKQEYAALLAEKKSLYGGYRKSKDASQELALARGNAERILGIGLNAKTFETPHGQSKHNAPER